MGPLELFGAHSGGNSGEHTKELINDAALILQDHGLKSVSFVYK